MLNWKGLIKLKNKDWEINELKKMLEMFFQHQIFGLGVFIELEKV